MTNLAFRLLGDAALYSIDATPVAKLRPSSAISKDTLPVVFLERRSYLCTVI